MDVMQAMEARHSVRSYTGKKIEGNKRQILDDLIRQCNAESGLHIQIRYDDPTAFDSALAHYGKFRNVENYLILAGTPRDDLEEQCGYYGERIVLEAQMLGLNTCWVALSFHRSVVKRRIPANEKLIAVIAIGYGETMGSAHKSKSIDRVVSGQEEMPDWFWRGAEAALLAPTAINQQKFKIELKNGKPWVSVSGMGPYTKIDLGIVKYHFEVASGHQTAK